MNLVPPCWQSVWQQVCFQLWRPLASIIHWLPQRCTILLRLRWTWLCLDIFKPQCQSCLHISVSTIAIGKHCWLCQMASSMIDCLAWDSCTQHVKFHIDEPTAQTHRKGFRRTCKCPIQCYYEIFVFVCNTLRAINRPCPNHARTTWVMKVPASIGAVLQGPQQRKWPKYFIHLVPMPCLILLDWCQTTPKQPGKDQWGMMSTPLNSQTTCAQNDIFSICCPWPACCHLCPRTQPASSPTQH